MPATHLNCASLLLLAAGLLRAAVNLSGPLAGYVADPTRAELRAITGTPGSYLFSDPLPLPDGATRLHLSPSQDFALMESGDTGLAVLLLSGGAASPGASIPDALPSADWVAFSSNGASAVLYSTSGHRLQLLTGLPGNPLLARDLDTTTLPEQPLTAALNQDGSLLLLASGHSLYRIAAGAPAQLVLSAGAILSVAVLPNGTDAVVADRSTASLHLLRNVATAPVDQVLTPGLSGMSRIYPSSDGGTLFVARPGARAVTSVDLATGNVQTCASPTPPVELIPLRNRDTFLTSARTVNRTGQPGTVFFVDAGAGRVVFIPATKSEDVQ